MRKIVAFFIAGFMCTQLTAQDLKLAFYASPTINWLNSNDNTITADGNIIGFRLDLSAQYYLTENYSVTGGIALNYGSGGTLLHESGGNFFPDSELSDDALFALANNTKVQYRLNYIELPIALRLQTTDFGELRYFAEVPTFHLSFGTRSTADISGDVASEGENIRQDIAPFQISWGLGGGAEYALSDRMHASAGLFFRSGILDVTGNDGSLLNGEKLDARNASNGLYLRLGLIF